jgi:hypothetical protein
MPQRPPRQRLSSNALVVIKAANPRLIGEPEAIQKRNGLMGDVARGFGAGCRPASSLSPEPIRHSSWTKSNGGAD